MTYNWWAVEATVEKEPHLVGLDSRMVSLPTLFRTKVDAERDISAWKREDPKVKAWRLRAVKVEIRARDAGKEEG